MRGVVICKDSLFIALAFIYDEDRGYYLQERPVLNGRRKVKGQKKCGTCLNKSHVFSSLMRTNCARLLSFFSFFFLPFINVCQSSSGSRFQTLALLTHRGRGWSWSEADTSWSLSLTSASSDLHKVTLTELHLLLLCSPPLFSL